MIITLRTADTADLTAAEARLHRALLASSTGRLLGSATTHGRAAFTDLFTASRCFGRVDLAVSGDRIDRVACWIDHPHGPVGPPATAPSNGLDDVFARLHMIDLVVGVSDGSAGQHLAGLGTRPGYDARMIADLLLYRRCLLNDRHGHAFYTDVHDQRFGAWLLMRSNGYHRHGVSLGTDTDPESHLISYSGTPP